MFIFKSSIKHVYKIDYKKQSSSMFMPAEHAKKTTVAMLEKKFKVNLNTSSNQF